MIPCAEVPLDSLVIHFANGTDEQISLRQTIRPGGQTEPINLDSADRPIESIEFATANPARELFLHRNFLEP
jgi:hypothetical protein